MFKGFLFGLSQKIMGKKWAVFLDNATIHTSAATKRFLNELPGATIPVIRNLVSRPDLNGIEVFWRYAKLFYRSTIDGHKVNGREWDQLTVVASCIESVSSQKAKDAAAQGWQNLENAKPVEAASADRKSRAKDRLQQRILGQRESDEESEDSEDS